MEYVTLVKGTFGWEIDPWSKTSDISEALWRTAERSVGATHLFYTLTLESALEAVESLKKGESPVYVQAYTGVLYGVAVSRRTRLDIDYIVCERP